MRSSIALLVAILFLPIVLHAQKPRERDLALPIGGTPGALDAITDVAGALRAPEGAVEAGGWV